MHLRRTCLMGSLWLSHSHRFLEHEECLPSFSSVEFAPGEEFRLHLIDGATDVVPNFCQLSPVHMRYTTYFVALNSKFPYDFPCVNGILQLTILMSMHILMTRCVHCHYVISESMVWFSSNCTPSCVRFISVSYCTWCHWRVRMSLFEMWTLFAAVISHSLLHHKTQQKCQISKECGVDACSSYPTLY